MERFARHSTSGFTFIVHGKCWEYLCEENSIIHAHYVYVSVCECIFGGYLRTHEHQMYKSYTWVRSRAYTDAIIQ